VQVPCDAGESISPLLARRDAGRHSVPLPSTGWQRPLPVMVDPTAPALLRRPPAQAKAGARSTMNRWSRRRKTAAPGTAIRRLTDAGTQGSHRIGARWKARSVVVTGAVAPSVQPKTAPQQRSC